MSTLNYEATDLYGGEANYSWVKRGQFESKPTTMANVRYIKKLLGYSGIRHRTEDYGDMVRIDLSPGGVLHVIFLTWEG